MHLLYTRFFTKAIREGTEPKEYGSNITGIRWSGQKLAERLNGDRSIADDFMKCVKSWSFLEFQIEAISPNEVVIAGPRFSNPGAIAQLYHSEYKEEIQCCAFSFDTVERIAGHIKNSG